MSDKNRGAMTYRDFASKITFFSFLNMEEFHQGTFKPERYRKELDALNALDDISVERLAKLLTEYPRTISLFSSILRDQRFSNTQIAHFCFDIEVINSNDPLRLVEKFDLHYRSDEFFRSHVETELEKLHDENIITQTDVSALADTEKIILLKRAVQLFCSKEEYLNRLLPKPEFGDVSLRTARYLIDNLWLDRFLKAIDVEQYLLAKRRVKDTKGLHGNFGSEQVRVILERHGIVCIDDDLGNNRVLRPDRVHPNFQKSLDQANGSKKWTYATQKYIEGMIKPKDGKGKQFDFVLLRDGIPKIAIETNYYTTVGTKIGININEYTDVLEHSKAKGIPVHFIWITDGPSWLETNQRRDTFVFG